MKRYSNLHGILRAVATVATAFGMILSPMAASAVPSGPLLVPPPTTDTAGTHVLVTFDRDLLQGYTLTPANFTVKVNSTLDAVTAAAYDSARVVSLTLTTPVLCGDTATVAIAADAVQEASPPSKKNAAIADTAVTNAVPPAALVLTPTPTITGSASFGSTLTAVPGTWDAGVMLAYQWIRDAADPISGAMSETYTIAAADVGHTLKVAVTGSKLCCIDATKTSAPTDTVTAIPLAIPANVSATAIVQTGFSVLFDTVTNAVSYDVRVYTDSMTTTEVIGSPFSGATPPIAVTGLTASTTYWVTVQARAGAGTGYSDGAASTPIEVTTAAPPAPTFVSAMTNAAGTAVHITFNEDLDTSVPLVPSWFGVKLNSAAVAVTGAAYDPLDTKTVILTLGTVAVNGDTLTVSYTQGLLKGASILLIASFADQPVTNMVPGPAPQLLYVLWQDSTHIALRFDLPMTASGADKTDFIIVDNGETTTNMSHITIEVSGETVTLIFPGGHALTETVTVQYVKGTLKGANGTLVESFGPFPALNYIPMAMTLTPTPTITGTPVFGSVLTAVPGTWDADVAFAYQWIRDGSPISGATGATYTLVGDDIGHVIRVAVTGSKYQYISVTKTSDPTAMVTGQTLAVPSVSASATSTTAISVTFGTVPNAVSYTVKVYTSAAKTTLVGTPHTGLTTSPVAITGLTASTTYYVTSQAIGDGTSYLNSAESAVTAVTTQSPYTPPPTYYEPEPAAPSLTLTPTPVISGTPVVGNVLTAVPGTWDAGVTLAYQWLRGGIIISGATGATLTLTDADLGSQISVRVTGSRPGYEIAIRLSAPTAQVTAAITPITEPVPAPTLDPVILTLNSGEVRVTEAGVVVPTTAVATEGMRSILVTGAGWTLEISIATAAGDPVLVGEGLVLRAYPGSVVTVRGTGFMANTEVRVYIMSTPVLLGTVTTDAAGAFVLTSPLPAGLELGMHMIQVNGFASATVVRSVSVQLLLMEPALISPITPITEWVLVPTTTVHKLSAIVTFNAYSPKLLTPAKKALAKLATQVRGYVAKGYEVKITVVNGYVQPERNTANDITLSGARAKAVAAELRRLGVPASISTFARGRAPEKTPAGRKAVTLITLTITK